MQSAFAMRAEAGRSAASPATVAESKGTRI